MVPKYGKKLNLCYMDTDSLIYNIETEDFCKDIADDVPARFDTSGYLLNRPLPIGLNKKVIGLMKDKLGGEIMEEFVTLRPKMYSYRTSEKESKKCKGIKKCVVRKTITFEDYKNCLFSGETSYRSQLMFRSLKHKIPRRTHDIFGRGCATIKSLYRSFLEFLTKKLDPFRNFCA